MLNMRKFRHYPASECRFETTEVLFQDYFEQQNKALVEAFYKIVFEIFEQTFLTLLV